MRKIIFILFVLATLPICTYAQGEVKDSVSVDAQEIKEAVEVQPIDVAELQKQINEETQRYFQKDYNLRAEQIAAHNIAESYYDKGPNPTLYRQ